MKALRSRYLPFIAFVVLLGLLFRGLYIDPHRIPSALLDKQSPTISLPLLNKQQGTLSNADFKGHLSLLNVWASWCEACRVEHPFLMQLAQRSHIPIYAMNYKDNPEGAAQLLAQWGNPYKKVGVDQIGTTAINWGVYGTPQTFVIDKQGIIRYKQIGPLTEKIWQRDILPIIKRYST